MYYQIPDPIDRLLIAEIYQQAYQIAAADEARGQSIDEIVINLVIVRAFITTVVMVVFIILLAAIFSLLPI